MAANGLAAEPGSHLLRIHFLIVGGSLTGYACALALCKAGHSVTVLDVEDAIETAWGHYAAAVTPNLYKLLVRWGMEDELKKCGTKAHRLRMADYHTGEHLGYHNWEEELLKDSGGDLLYCHLVDLKKILHDRAVSFGAEIRHDVAVTGISVKKGTQPLARLVSGEVIEADVILGADGPKSSIRREIIGQELHETPLGTALFNVRVPREKMLSDPELSELLQDVHTATIWTGKGYAGYSYLAGDEFTFFLYLPEAGFESYWYQHIEPAEVVARLGSVTPIVRRVVESANLISCFRLCEPPQVQPWIHPEGRVLLVLPIELMNVFHIIMPEGEQREQRDAALRSRRDAGLDALTGARDDFAVALWENDKLVFSYDAEEAAEEWWNDWGILDERANNAVRVLSDQIPVVQVDKEVQ